MILQLEAAKSMNIGGGGGRGLPVECMETYHVTIRCLLFHLLIHVYPMLGFCLRNFHRVGGLGEPRPRSFMTMHEVCFANDHSLGVTKIDQRSVCSYSNMILIDFSLTSH